MLDDCEHSQTYQINVLKIIVTKGANKITILMGLTIMQARISRQQAVEDFERSNNILKAYVKHLNN